MTARGASTDWYGELTQEGFWAPAVAPSGMTFYAGDKLPRWKGSLFVGTMKNQRLERFSFNEKGFISRPEWLLDDLKQRIRDVRQGPDGLLYLLTDEEAGAFDQARTDAAQANTVVGRPQPPRVFRFVVVPGLAAVCAKHDATLAERLAVRK